MPFIVSKRLNLKALPTTMVPFALRQWTEPLWTSVTSVELTTLLLPLLLQIQNGLLSRLTSLEGHGQRAQIPTQATWTTAQLRKISRWLVPRSPGHSSSPNGRPMTTMRTTSDWTNTTLPKFTGRMARPPPQPLPWPRPIFSRVEESRLSRLVPHIL